MRLTGGIVSTAALALIGAMLATSCSKAPTSSVETTAQPASTTMMAVGMGEPSVTIITPAKGAIVTSKDISVTVAIKKFDLECARAGQPGQLGRGHIHAMLDGTNMDRLTNVECAKSFSISGLGAKAGEHTLSVELASDDHMPASMPTTIRFSYESTAAQPPPSAMRGGVPELTLLSPKKGANVPRKFDLVVAVKNFDLSCDLEGKADLAGWGHLHVFVMQPGVTDQPAHNMKMPMETGGMTMMSMLGMLSMPCTTTVPVDLSSWKSGPAKITVMLANNDHMPTPGVRPTTVDVVIQ